jgi:hypothetical protein
MSTALRDRWLGSLSRLETIFEFAGQRQQAPAEVEHTSCAEQSCKDKPHNIARPDPANVLESVQAIVPKPR